MQVTKRCVLEVIRKKLELYVTLWCMLILTALLASSAIYRILEFLIAITKRELKLHSSSFFILYTEVALTYTELLSTEFPF